MADKDQFTFDDDDDFPGVVPDHQKDPSEPDLGGDEEFLIDDLGASFEEGEHEADVPFSEPPEMKEKGGDSSRTRMLLIVLLLVVSGGAGAYYFMGLDDTTPSVPTVTVPAQKKVASVSVPPPPATPPVAKTEPATKPVTVAVPPPPAVKPQAQEDPVKQTVTATKANTAADEPLAAAPTATKGTTPVTKTAPAPQPQAVTVKAAAKPEPAQQKAAASVPAPPPEKMEVKAVSAPPKDEVGGAYALDAGSYLFDANRDSLVMKIKKLGYEPIITPVDATLDMTRLRLGTHSKDEVQKALAFARTIEPGAYSATAGDRYVIYAGTFLQARNIDKLKQRFLSEGIKVRSEPVQVVRTLSRIRFGSFATQDEAAKAAIAAGEKGVQAAVVKSMK